MIDWLSSAAKYSGKGFTQGVAESTEDTEKRGELAWRTDRGVKGDGAEGPHFEVYRVVAYGGH